MNRFRRHPEEREEQPPAVDIDGSPTTGSSTTESPITESPTADVPAVFDDSVTPRDDDRVVTGADTGDETVGATPTTREVELKRTLAGGTWVALIVGALLLILLLVFILQNQQQVELNLFTWTFQFPAGIGYLFSAIAGALIMALVGGVRMIELHRQVRRLRKQRG